MEEKQGIDIRIEAQPNAEAVLMPAPYVNLLRASSDPIGMTTLYFFAMPTDVEKVPGLADRIQRLAAEKRPGPHAVVAELPAVAKVAMPVQTLVEFVKSLQEHLARMGVSGA